MYTRPNALGDLRAEADLRMLKNTFLETPDYRTLIETSDRMIVVGRRGTGKSALAIMLERHWQRADDIEVVKLSPEEHQIFGIRPIVQLFGDSFNKMRAGSRIGWRYALIMETTQRLAPVYSFSRTKGFDVLRPHLKEWRSAGSSLADRYRGTLARVVDKSLLPAEARIGELPKSLDLTEVEQALEQACGQCKRSVVLLIDRLDEGYEPDGVGTGLIAGLVQATIDLKTRIPQVKPIVFLRDNIFRAVQYLDPDYSRNIEGQVLRLHWDEDSLFSFATRRAALAFGIREESNQKIWNRITAGDLKGRNGFLRCLRLTLYRPRDLLALLNEAFYTAGKKGQRVLMIQHIEATARTYSQVRLEDLRKEYLAIVPGLREYIGVFADSNPEQSVDKIKTVINKLLAIGSPDPIIQQDFLILNDVQAVLRALYSVGFIGIRDKSSGSYIFCHDGRAPDRAFLESDRVLVHPSYWMALNCTRSTLNLDEAEEIYDEYDIEISSETPEIRNIRIKQLISSLSSIDEGTAGAADFELWCHKSIRICFAKGLRNVELKPNKLAKARRDIVATNLGESDAWRRIYEDYRTRQVIFEVKNYRKLKSADYQQVQSYLTGDYGGLGFVITRDESVDLYANRDVEWVREMYVSHKVLIIKLTGKYLCKLLHKLRNPQKHDAVNDALHKLLDVYVRLYLAGQTASNHQRSKKLEKRIGRRRKRSGRKAIGDAQQEPRRVSSSSDA